MKIYRDFEELSDAAEAGDADAQYELALGHMTGYCKGQVLTPSGAAAFGWMMKAAEQEHAAAMENIGRVYIHGFMGVDAGNRFLHVDRAAGLSWLQKAVVAGAAGACRELGLFYRYDDAHKAAEYFYKAAYYFGDTLALRYYAVALYYGDGIAQDEEAGRKVMLSALSMDADVTVEEADDISRAFGIEAAAPADDAARQTRRARAEGYYLAALKRRAEAGDPAGQYELALRYYLGRGIAQDMTAARGWLARAAEGGYAPAKRQLAALAAQTVH
ncbi:MAG TPA: hypothetical protein PLW48_11915 [Alphaproteobacteria bacterium]|nr:hypothetical protein [Rhodospirillaceae bacterium]HRJ67832.1 hypothetical protein [Alphaproteobacteria bacterium]